MPKLRIALAQINVTVGDLTGNRRLILDRLLQAKAWRADVVVFPELAVTGYPPEDLLLKPSFVADNLAELARLQWACQGIVAFVGFVDQAADGRLYNAAAVLAGGRRIATYHKQCLPNYGVFDEQRYFTPGHRTLALDLGGVRTGVSICEDLWEGQPIERIARAGCRLAINLSASPYHAGKLHERVRLFARRAKEHRLAIAYCNVVGGQDELIFDGASLMLDAESRVLAQGRQFRDDLVLADLAWAEAKPPTDRPVVRVPWAPSDAPPVAATRRPGLERRHEVYEALTLGVRDYVRKNGFTTVVLGLSGGIDSSLVACVAVDALGAEQVVGVVMPSRFSSSATQGDARELARRLGIRCETISIEACFSAFLKTLQPLFAGRPDDVAEQNLQARIRGTLLMALSNKFGWLVLTTGNKSEMATGYCTLYGDMAGGFAVIKDVPKTLVYELARFRNARGPGAGPISARILARAPTAELAPNQKDQDTLPPYEVLDPIIRGYVEEDRGVQHILGRGRFQAATVGRVIRMIDASEYKRRQAPPGVKITPKAFGKDRRMPITNRYRERDNGAGAS